MGEAGNGHAVEIPAGPEKENCWNQNYVRQLYTSDVCQVGVAVLIGANFVTNMVEKEIDPQGEKYADVFEIFGHFYNACFTIELIVNLYAHWFKQFWMDGWNIFDFIVVSIGVINTVQLPLPPAFSMLRMMRAFRVFRLFKRVESLNKIIVSIIHAVPGVMNAFLILFIVMAIFAILAVEFYWDIGAGCMDPAKPEMHRWRTVRGNCLGDEYFGTFTKSLYTFFQVLTGESWSEMVARPAIWYFIDEPVKALGGGVFFVLYVCLTAYLLANVVVAVLLDKMSDPEVLATMPTMESESSPEPSAEEEAKNGSSGEPADPKEHPSAALSKVEAKVEGLMNSSDTMDNQLTKIKSEMAVMREQLTAILSCIQ